MCHTGAHHLQTGAEREERCVLAHHKEVQPVTLFRRLFHQMTMAEGERIGVHHNRANRLPASAAALQRAAVALDPLWGVLQQNGVITALGNRPETAAGEALFIARAGAEKEMKVTTRQRGIFYFRQQAGAEIRAPQLFIHRHALDDVGSQPRTSHQL
ncbi:hypothetical protein D3C72_1915760 [compost metagenome]